ncbi:MAG: potassium-transporting ATPase subunit F [Advenella sp.]|jgi:K+-transporting ATPase KdpF subunit|uniref:K+-transporting ATPase KdpF subunit n=1 Tax=Advenella incenata TaxID=267800 RepID=A0A4Q7V7Y9_9BURK|nr:potassium-transporting ATPase subunit F [Advenella incenata]RZT91590.1 K+-transporting ATPase KdpF subunit [Advenella incenata]
MMETMLLFLCSFVALLVLVYLVYALLNAEKF